MRSSHHSATAGVGWVGRTSIGSGRTEDRSGQDRNRNRSVELGRVARSKNMLPVAACRRFVKNIPCLYATASYLRARSPSRLSHTHALVSRVQQHQARPASTFSANQRHGQRGEPLSHRSSCCAQNQVTRLSLSIKRPPPALLYSSQAGLARLALVLAHSDSDSHLPLLARFVSSCKHERGPFSPSRRGT